MAGCRSLGGDLGVLYHRLIVAVRPVISVTPEKLVVTEGDAAAFSCNIHKGSPTPQVSEVELYRMLQ